uniref:tandem C2 domains nuclear protein isoform X1 n=1 Tax=Myxine glutinosa TaxID=7769 RepID=UPI00358F7199
MGAVGTGIFELANKFCRKCMELCGQPSRSNAIEEGSVESGADYLERKVPSGQSDIAFVLPRLQLSSVQPERAAPNTEVQPGMVALERGACQAVYAQRKKELLGRNSAEGLRPHSTTPSRLEMDRSTKSLKRSTSELPPAKWIGRTKSLASFDPESETAQKYKAQNGGARAIDVPACGSDRTSFSSRRTSPIHNRHSSIHSECSLSKSELYSSMSSISSSLSANSDQYGSSLYLDAEDGNAEPATLTVKLRFEEPMQQLWITVVQADVQESRLKPTAKPSFYVKGMVKTDKSWNFKTTTKSKTTCPEFNEAFVYSVDPAAMTRARLHMYLLARTPRKYLLGEAVLPLQDVCPEDTTYTVPLREIVVSQVIAGGELQLGTCLNLSDGTIAVQVLEAKNLRKVSGVMNGKTFVKVELHVASECVEKWQTHSCRTHAGAVSWDDTFTLPAINKEQKFLGVSVVVRVGYRDALRRYHLVGKVTLGFDSQGSSLQQWEQTVINPDKTITMWHHLH